MRQDAQTASTDHSDQPDQAEYPDALESAEATELAELIGDYGDRFEIVRDAEHGLYMAIRRPSPTATHYAISQTPAALRRKLEAEPPDPQADPPAGPLTDCE